MGRIPLVEYGDAPPDLREPYDRIQAARGSVLNVYKGIANHPQALRPLFELISATCRGKSLEPRHRSWRTSPRRRSTGATIESRPTACSVGASASPTTRS